MTPHRTSAQVGECAVHLSEGGGAAANAAGPRPSRLRRGLDVDELLLQATGGQLPYEDG